MRYLNPDGIGVVILDKRQGAEGKYFLLQHGYWMKDSFLGSPLTLGKIGDKDAFIFDFYTQSGNPINLLKNDIGIADEPHKPLKVIGEPGHHGVPPIWALE